MGTPQQQSDKFEESYSFDDSYIEPRSGQLGEDWDTMMEEFFDEYEDFKDINIQPSDDDY